MSFHCGEALPFRNRQGRKVGRNPWQGNNLNNPLSRLVYTFLKVSTVTLTSSCLLLTAAHAIPFIMRRLFVFALPSLHRKVMDGVVILATCYPRFFLLLSVQFIWARDLNAGPLNDQAACVFVYLAMRIRHEVMLTIKRYFIWTAAHLHWIELERVGRHLIVLFFF